MLEHGYNDVMEQALVRRGKYNICCTYAYMPYLRPILIVAALLVTAGGVAVIGVISDREGWDVPGLVGTAYAQLTTDGDQTDKPGSPQD